LLKCIKSEREILKVKILKGYENTTHLTRGLKTIKAKGARRKNAGRNKT